MDCSVVVKIESECQLMKWFSCFENEHSVISLGFVCIVVILYPNKTHDNLNSKLTSLSSFMYFNIFASEHSRDSMCNNFLFCFFSFAILIEVFSYYVKIFSFKN